MVARTRNGSQNVLDGNAIRTVKPHELAGRSLSPEVDAELRQTRAESRAFDREVMAQPGMNPSTRRVQLAYPRCA